jgi:NAD(P)-dependent dehydrogenase (short-subunit alcohol dehydrogenase family)
MARGHHRPHADRRCADGNQLRLPNGQLLSGSLESTAKAIEAAGGEVFPHVMDLMDLSSLDKAADAVLKRFGRVDLLINNAVYQNREINHLIPEITAESLQRSMLGNVIAPFHLAQRLLPAMAAQGGGRIINVCSAAGQYNPPVPADQGGWGLPMEPPRPPLRAWPAASTPNTSSRMCAPSASTPAW